MNKQSARAECLMSVSLFVPNALYDFGQQSYKLCRNKNKGERFFLSLLFENKKKSAIESQRDVLRSHIGRKNDCWPLEQQTNTHAHICGVKKTFINCVPIIVNVDYNKAGGFGRRFSSVFFFTLVNVLIDMQHTGCCYRHYGKPRVIPKCDKILWEWLDEATLTKNKTHTQRISQAICRFVNRWLIYCIYEYKVKIDIIYWLELMRKKKKLQRKIFWQISSSSQMKLRPRGKHSNIRKRAKQHTASSARLGSERKDFFVSEIWRLCGSERTDELNGSLFLASPREKAEEKIQKFPLSN